MNTKVIDLKLHSFKRISLFIQIILIVLLVVFGVIGWFNKDFKLGFYIVISLTMFTMAYNNVKFYKRKYMTPIYIVFGIFVAITTLLEYLL